MDTRPPIAISYLPKEIDYLPLVVASIREALGDWPIVLMTQKMTLPPVGWLHKYKVQAITDWSHSEGANKALRIWEHQEFFARHFDRWIWWNDDMFLLRHVADPEEEFDRPRVRFLERKRPNKKLNKWHVWLWDTLNFFQCQGINAPNPVLHTPRLISRDLLNEIPRNWDRTKMLFDVTYLLWSWHLKSDSPFVDKGFRYSVFSGVLPNPSSVFQEGFTILNWGKNIDHEQSRRTLEDKWSLSFEV